MAISRSAIDGGIARGSSYLFKITDIENVIRETIEGGPTPFNTIVKGDMLFDPEDIT